MTKITAVLEQSMTDEVKKGNEDLIAFGMDIDFTPLFQAISKKLGLVNTLTFSTPQIYERHGDFHVDCKSDSIVDRTGVFLSVLDEVRIEFFSNRIEKDKGRGCHVFWAYIHLAYHHMAGGSNGLEFATAWIDNEKGWSVKFVEPRNRD